MPGTPLGLHCPRCGQPPFMALDQQAFCENPNCVVFCWNPQDDRETFEQQVTVIDLPFGD